MADEIYPAAGVKMAPYSSAAYTLSVLALSADKKQEREQHMGTFSFRAGNCRYLYTWSPVVTAACVQKLVRGLHLTSPCLMTAEKEKAL